MHGGTSKRAKRGGAGHQATIREKKNKGGKGKFFTVDGT